MDLFSSKMDAPRSWASTARLFALGCILTAVTNFPAAFTHTSLNTAVHRMTDYLNESYTTRGLDLVEDDIDLIRSFINSVWYAGQVAGALASPLICDNYGRKVAYQISVAMMGLAYAVQTLATYTDYPEVLIIGRIVTSVFSPLSDAALILYLQEVSPTSIRGTMSSLYSTGYCLMALIGMVCGHDELFGHDLTLLLAIPALAAIPSLIFTIIMPETPKFLWLSRQDKAGALRSLKFYQGHGTDHLNSLCVIQKESEAEEKDDNGKASCSAIFRSPSLLRAFLLSVAVLVITLPFYPILQSSTYFFVAINIERSFAQTSSSLLMAVLTVACIISTSIVDRLPRRSMLIYAGTSCMLTLCSFVISSQLNYPMVAMSSIFGFIFAYGVGIGPVVWSIPAELVPLSHRSVMFCVCYAVHSVLVVFTNFLTIPLFDSEIAGIPMGSLAFIPLYIFPGTIALIYVALNIPETNGRETHDIIAELRGGRKKTRDIEDTRL